MRILRDTVVFGYRLVLGRDPESEQVIAEKLKLADNWKLAFDLLFLNKEFDDNGRRARVISAKREGSIPAQGIREIAKSHPAPEPISRDTVIWAYRLLLQREPESEQVILEKQQSADDIDLLRAFIHSEEFLTLSKNWRSDFEDGLAAPPLPPLRLRRTVGPIDKGAYDNPDGLPVFGDEVPLENYASVFDFGCGCGRIARQLIQQRHPPKSYVGVDLNLESIEWCTENLSNLHPNFVFLHLDAFNKGLNPKSKVDEVRFPIERSFKLVNAHSVFTHITEEHVEHYLSECSRILDRDGIFRASWFLFDKSTFPMMQEFQNCLYINTSDPTNATIYDYRFVQRKYEERGMVITKITPPTIKGFQWILLACASARATSRATFPEDVAPVGIARPPI